jgi:biopolymer transport protein ExbD
MNLRRRIKSHQELHAGALNDILFILLFFFLIVSTLANPNLIRVNVPRAKSNTKAKQTIIVSIKPDGEYYVGQKKVDPSQLKQELSPILQKDTANAAIVVNMDSTVAIWKGFVVIRAAQELGVKATFGVAK